MAVPLNSCERRNTTTLNRNIPITTLTSLPQDQLVNNDIGFGGNLGGGGFQQLNPPPIPQRPYSNEFNSVSRFGYSSMNPYGMTGMSPYAYNTPYSGYGGMGYGGMGYGGYGNGYGNRSDSQFIQFAEENYRNTLQPIESIVQTIGSISMMIETTFYTLNSSFRAVVSVADQFARMKAHIGHIFSALTLFKGLKWLYKRVLQLLGKTQQDSPSEIWNEMENVGKDKLNGKNMKKNQFSALLILILIFGTPYLLYKLVMLAAQQQNTKEWAIGQALFDFVPQSNREIALKAGQNVKIAPKDLQPFLNSQWILVSVDDENTGLVPVSYIKKVINVKGDSNNELNTLFDEISTH